MMVLFVPVVKQMLSQTSDCYVVIVSTGESPQQAATFGSA